MIAAAEHLLLRWLLRWMLVLKLLLLHVCGNAKRHFEPRMG